MSHVCSLFLRRGGTIHCRISGGRRYLSNLPQGRLEVPCKAAFSTKAEAGAHEPPLAAHALLPEEIKKLKRLKFSSYWFSYNCIPIFCILVQIIIIVLNL